MPATSDGPAEPSRTAGSGSLCTCPTSLGPVPTAAAGSGTPLGWLVSQPAACTTAWPFCELAIRHWAGAREIAVASPVSDLLAPSAPTK